MSESTPCPHCGKTLRPASVGGLCPECMLKLGASRPTEWPDETAAVPPGDRRPPPPSPEEMAQHFPQLEILECLGRGGMGVVYKARQPKLNRFVALKVLAPERGAESKFSERFEREAQTLARLSHPHIVAVHDYGEAGGIYYLLMEYVDGRSLRDVLRAGTLKPEEALAIVPPICEALQFAHEHGVVHRDIKPENVLLDQQGRVKIADFGVAKLVGEERPHPALTDDQQVVGTPHYMAPEQVEKPQLVDHRADIYSLGVVLYEMLTGELPLGKFPPPSKKVLVDVRLDEVVLRALEKEPEQRYQKASQVKTDLEGISVGTLASPPECQKPTETERLPKSGPRIPDLETENDEGPERHGLSAVPPVLWIAILAMVGAGIWRQLTSPGNPLWLFADGLLVAGLIYRFKLAYAATVLFALLGVLFAAFTGPPGLVNTVLLLNGVAAAAVLLCTEWFFPEKRPTNVRTGGDWVVGMVFSLPPVACLWFVRGGFVLCGIDLDADVRFFVGALGLPLSAAAGLLLALVANRLLSPFAGSALPTDSLAQPRRWSLWAIGAGALWVLSLPLGGGTMVMFDLIRRDPDWNPGGWEALFVLTLGVLSALTIVGSAVLGTAALQELRNNPARSRGWLGAIAATRVWPFLLCSLVLPTWPTRHSPTAEEATRAAKTEQARLQALRRSENPPATPFLGPSTRRHHLRLSNNAELEIVAVCRNPRNAPHWRGPDGAPLVSSSVKIVKLPAPTPSRSAAVTVRPENEFLVYARWTLPEGVRIHSSQPGFDPRPSNWDTSAKVFDLDRGEASYANLVGYPTPPDSVTYSEAVSFGPWTPVTIYDLGLKQAKDVLPDTMALWSEPLYDRDARALRQEIMHNVDRRTYALRLRARYQNGKEDTLVFHSGAQSGSPTKGFALIHGSEAESRSQLAQVQELVLERTPWVHCEIPGVALITASQDP